MSGSEHERDARLEESRAHLGQALETFWKAVTALEDEKDQQACVRLFLSMVVRVASRAGFVDADLEEVFPMPERVSEALDFISEAQDDIDELPGMDDNHDEEDA
jgi:hypothetical protein